MPTSATPIAAGTAGDVLLELGAVLLVLAAVGRAAHRFGIPTIPLYLGAGLLMGKGGAIPLPASSEFIAVAADVGVVLLLLLLGLEYTPRELRDGLRRGWVGGVVDLVLSSLPGVGLALLLGWGPAAAAVLGGVTYMSSSGIVAKQLVDLGRLERPETRSILTVLVIEDLVMAAYLPTISVVLTGGSPAAALASVGLALLGVGVAFFVATRFGRALGRVVDTRSPELLLLGILGLVLLLGGAAERIQVSAAVAAFLVGVALSESVAERGREVLLPIRDVFGGLFFVFFGIQVDPRTLPPTLLPALLLAVAGVATKYLTGWWMARRDGVDADGRVRAGVALIARGEFSIVIAGLAVGAAIEPDLGPVATSYVLALAVVGSVAMRYVRPPATAGAT